MSRAAPACRARQAITCHAGDAEPSSSARTSPVQCPQTAEMAGLIAADAATLIDMLGELIGAGNPDSNTLACMRLMVCRIGAVADVMAAAHGGHIWGCSPDALDLAGEQRAAFDLLRQREVQS